MSDTCIRAKKIRIRCDMEQVLLTPRWAEGLTPLERRFVGEYLIDLNVKRAVAACFESEYASELSAKTSGYALLKKPSVARAISIALNEEGITKTWIIGEYARIAQANLSDFVTIRNGRVIVHNHDELVDKDVDLTSVAEISETISEFGTAIKVRLHDKMNALGKLAKLLGYEKEKIETSGDSTMTIKIGKEFEGL